MADQRRTPRGSRPRRRSRRPGARRARPRRRRRARRPPTAARGRPAPPAPRPRLTGRAAILVLVLAVLTVSYASSLRAYLQQRAHIGDLKAQIAEREAEHRRLEREKQRWQDPAYVEAQARERFGYVMPGETSYVVLDEDGEPLESDADRCPTPTTVLQRRADRVVRRRLGLGASSPATRRRDEAPAPRSPRSTAPTEVRGGARGDRPRRRGGDRGPARARAAAAIHDVGHRCPCGNPDVVTTEPRLPNGTPFPTTFYLTCPRAASRIGTLEGSGLMKEMQDRLGDGPGARGGVPRAPTSATSRPGPSSARCPRSRGSPPAACPTGSSACTCSPASRSPRAAASTRSATRCSTCSATGGRAGPVRRRPEWRMTRVAAIDCGTNTIKLLIGDLPGRARSRETADGPARPGRRPHRPARRRGAGAGVRGDRRVRRADPPRTASTRIRFCATSATRDAANARRLRRRRARAARGRPGGAVRRRGGRARLRRRGPRTCADAAGAGAGGRHRRRLDRADPRRRPRPTRRTRWTSARCGCTSGTCTSDPPTADEVGGLRGRHRRRARRAARSTRPRRRTVVGVAGTSPRWRPGCSTCRRTTATPSTSRSLPRRRRARDRRPAASRCRSPSGWRCPTCTPAAPT